MFRQVGTRVLAHARANTVGYAALFVALGGVAFGAAKPLLDKPGAVDSRNIENHQVKQKDLSNQLESKLGIGSVAGASSDGNYVSAPFSVTDKGSYQINLTLTNAKVTSINVTPLGSDGTCSFVPDTQGGISTEKLGQNAIDVNATNLQESWILEIPFAFVSETEMETNKAKGQIVKGDTTCFVPDGVVLKREGGTS